MGYFELEQRLDVATAQGGGGSAASSGATSGGGGISITLKVYGDVWRWLADDKVCSLREQVVEARFSLVHVTSVARKATTIAQVSTTTRVRTTERDSGRGAKDHNEGLSLSWL